MPADEGLRLANARVPAYSASPMTIFESSVNLRRLSFAAIISLVAACASGPAPQDVPNHRGETTVYVVRHAEKAPPTAGDSDVDLSATGYARADSLAVQLREAGIDAVITTQLKRTRFTARPIAAKRGVTPQVVPAGSSVSAHAESVAVAVRRYQGSRVLVVGHSNTVGPIITALGGPRIGNLCDNEYSNLFILTLSREAPTRLLSARYGQPDPPGDGKCTPVRR